MKSARERAVELAKMAGWHEHDCGANGRAFIVAAEKAFKEHARDQRQNCASRVADCYDREFGRVAPIVASAPAPGEEP